MRNAAEVFGRDESTPFHPESAAHPLVIFGDHRFCAGASFEVMPMPRPHMHSQIELNFLLEGAMTYWFDGHELTVSSGQLALFWGMIPHQVTKVIKPTRFVCLYVPMPVFLALPTLSTLRGAILKGAMIDAQEIRSFDRDIFLRWREDLLSGDEQLEEIVRDELTARVRRLDREGWRDLRELAASVPAGASHDGERALHVERMVRFIGEKAHDAISVADVADVAGLHPNYAMTVFKRTVGMTINQSIVRHRLDTARSMLVSTDQPVAAIAFDSGFGSLSRFYQAFEERFHSSPANFRKRFVAVRG